jgi:hypothetical protein
MWERAFCYLFAIIVSKSGSFSLLMWLEQLLRAVCDQNGHEGLGH